MLWPCPAGPDPLGQERPADARALLEQAIDVWSQVETTYGQPYDADLRYYFASAALVQGDADAAAAHLNIGLREFQASGDDLGTGVVLGSLGLLAAQRGDHAEARARFAEAMPLLRSGGDHRDLAVLLLNSGLEGAHARLQRSGHCSSRRCAPGSNSAIPHLRFELADEGKIPCGMPVRHG